MSSNQNNFRISNEQLLLINILNTMYNDNLRQINSVTETLNNLHETNTQIRGLLVQLLGTVQNNANNSNIPRRNRNYERRDNDNINRINNFNRGFLGGQSYIIDNITEYTIPLRSSGNYRNNRNNRNDQGNSIFSQLLQSFLQPVEVYPTQSQIEAATRYVRYCDIARPINTQCPISMDDFNDNDMVTVIRPCGHIFNTNCLQNWFRTNCRCPVCRYDIREYNSNASTEFFTNQQPLNTQQTSNSNSNLERTTSISSVSNNNNERNNFEPTDPLLSTSVLDMSGNVVNISADLLTSYILNSFTRNRNDH